MQNRKMGKLPFKYDERTLQFHKYNSSVIIPTPPVLHWKNPSPLGMLLNDELGDCVPAGRLHLKMVQLFNHGITWIAPNSLALSDYEAVGKYNPNAPLDPDGTNPTDGGCVILDMLKYLQNKGAILAYGQVDMTNHDHVKQAIFLFGPLLTGWALPKAFDYNATIWTPPSIGLTGAGTPGSLGGHCTCAPGYDANAIDNITWGERIKASWDYVDDYSDEGWFVITHDWIAKNNESPSGFNITQLLADQKLVTAA